MSASFLLDCCWKRMEGGERGVKGREKKSGRKRKKGKKRERKRERERERERHLFTQYIYHNKQIKGYNSVMQTYYTIVLERGG